MAKLPAARAISALRVLLMAFNAAGVRLWRVSSTTAPGAKIVPRNTLALWGLAQNRINPFWDGKLIDEGSGVVSQFGTSRPPRTR